MRRALLVSLGLLIAACGSDAPKEPPRDPNLVAVTFYRPHSDLHPADYPFVHVDTEKKGPLADNTSMSVDVQAGPHKMSLANSALWDSEQSWQFSPKAGRHYYFRLQVGEAEGREGSLPRYVSRFARVDEVPEQAALTEIAAMQSPAK